MPSPGPSQTALVVQAHQRPLRIACVREHQRAIKDSAKRTLELQIQRAHLGGSYKSTRENITNDNGSYFFFAGMSTVSEEDIRGWEDVDIVWVEEAHRMSHTSWEILRNTIRKPGAEIWFSFNPKNRYDPVYRDMVLGSPEGRLGPQGQLHGQPVVPRWSWRSSAAPSSAMSRSATPTSGSGSLTT